MILEILITLVLVVSIAIIINGVEDNRKKDAISFREALDLAGLPIITFKIQDKKLHFVLDTGATKSILNAKIANKLAAKLEGDSKIVGIEGTTRECSYTTLSLTYKDKVYEEKFSVLDMSSTFKEIKNMYGVTLHGVLGSSFMEKYKYVLDFKEMIAYTRK